MPSLWILAIAAAAAFFGAVVQGGIGLGMGLIAGPVIALLEPSLMPGAPLVLGVTISSLSLTRELGHADWKGLGWALGGRFAGTFGGVAVVAVLSRRALSVSVGVMVLLALLATIRSVRVPQNPLTITSAGVIGGVTGTSTSIAGPPMALIYQHDEGPRIRSTLAVFFCAGSLVSLAALSFSGHMPGEAWLTGLVLIPFVLAGFAASARLRGYLDRGRTRAAVLWLVAVSAIVLIARSFL